MTIKRGDEWGVPVARAADLRTASDDAELAAMLRTDRVAPITVTGGDVHRALGSPPSRDQMQRLPMDLLHVHLDDESTIAVAHVVVRRSWWLGPIHAAFNVSIMGEWNPAPRAHPNDGVADTLVVEAGFGVRARWQARSRLPAGTHVPHPKIATRRVTEVDWHFERPIEVTVDGRAPYRSRAVRIRVEPDAFELDV